MPRFLRALILTGAAVAYASFASFAPFAAIGPPIATARAAPLVDVIATRQGRAIELRMLTTLSAPHRLIWETLTDYQNQPRWIPGMASSEVLERRPPSVIVEQKGFADVLFLSFAVDVVVQATERPPDAIDVRLVRGNLKRLEGGYQLRRRPGTTDEYELEWSGTIEPDGHVPGFMSLPFVRNNVRRQFEGMVAEIERRAQALRAKN